MQQQSHTNRCACGCGTACAGQWVPGHDQKLRAAIEREVGGLVELRRIVEELLHRSIELKHTPNGRAVRSNTTGRSNIRQPDASHTRETIVSQTDTRLHNLYVIELDKEVLRYDEFERANPQYRPGMPCLYVGETRHTPRKRFNYHLVGYKSHEFVRRFAKRLLPEYYAHLNPVSRDRAGEEEQRLADRLRALGCAVWQHDNALQSQQANKKARHSRHQTVHQHPVGA